MSDAKVLKIGEKKPRQPWRNTQKTALKQDRDELSAKLNSMGMLLHALIKRHGKQLFELDAIEQCDPLSVHVDIDYEAGRVEVRLTADAEK